MTSRNSSQIVKPNDLTGGKGISVVEAGVDSKQSLEKAFGLSRSGVVVVEEFITGTLHSAAIVLVDKTPKFLMLADERSLENPFLVSSAETPTVLDELVGKEVSECVEQIAQHLSLTDGLVHVQFIYDGNKPWIIEICRRPPGDLYLDLVEFSTGFSLAGSYLQQCLGMSIEVPFGIQARPFLRQCVMSPKNGWVENFIMSAELSSAIVERVDLRTLPARIVDFEKEKLAILFCGFDDPQWTSEMSKNIRSHIDFVYG
jgi:biotin carboxylase